MKVTGIISAAALSLLLGMAVPALAQQEPSPEQQDHPKEQKSAPAEQKSAHEQGKHDQQHAAQPKQSKEKQDRAGNQSEQKQNEAQRSLENKPGNERDQHAQQQEKPEAKRAKAEQARHQGEPKNDQKLTEQKRENDEVGAQRGHGEERVEPTMEQHRVQQTTWRQHRSRDWQSEHRTWAQRGGYRGYRIPDDSYRGYFGPEHGFRLYGLPFMAEGGFPRFRYGGYWMVLADPWPEYWGDDWFDRDEVYVAYVDNGYYMYNRRYPTVGIAINISN